MLQRQIILLLLGLVFLSGCVSHRQMQMIKDENLAQAKGYTDPQMYDLFTLDDYVFRSTDQLFIKVNSYEGNTKDLFNEGIGESGSLTSQSLYFTTYNYPIDKEGFITLPLIGRQKAVGLTTKQVKDSLDIKLGAYLKNPSTIVRLSSFKITVLGEVNTPGVHEIFADRVSLLQAFGLTGGVTEFADLANVKLVRETADNQVGTIYLDLSTTGIHKSEFYFLRPGDVIYVEPLKAKSVAVSSNTIGLFFQSLSILGVVLNSIALILNLNRTTN
ncbi:MAG: polysaccharide biosynthesis/export family protein [Bacteroidota bacterium]